MNNIAIIPARSGSKGLIHKNIKELKGIPLLAYSINAAEKSGMFKEIMVSTDNQDYAQIAMSYGAKVPFLRSAETSTDNANSWDVVTEVLRSYWKNNIMYDTVCLLQPTSPLRTSDDILKGYEEFIKRDADAITAVTEMQHSPLWATTLDETLSLSSFRKNSNLFVPRQKLQKYYRINGALYIRRIEYSNNDIVLKESNEYAMIMERSRSVDIDTKEDFDYAEFLLCRQE